MNVGNWGESSLSAFHQRRAGREPVRVVGMGRIRVKDFVKAIMLIAWLTLGLFAFALGGGVLIGISMAAPGWTFAVIMLTIVAALFCGWWRLTVVVARKLQLRD